MTLAKWLYVTIVATALALLVVSQSTVIRARGYRLEHLRRQVQRKEARAQIYTAQLSKLRSPKRILPLLKELEMDLVAAPARTDSRWAEGGDVMQHGDVPAGTGEDAERGSGSAVVLSNPAPGERVRCAPNEDER